MALRIVAQTEDYIVVDKPPRFFVHQPENQNQRLPHFQSCVAALRKQLNRQVYPIHRLDKPTSGVLIFALNKESAFYFSKQFQERQVFKSYYCIVRGFIYDQTIIQNLEIEDKVYPAITHVKSLAHLELPVSLGRFERSRYSLVQVIPETGRTHQIRRHMFAVSHPIIGDRKYGDSTHNNYFRDELKISNLLLKAYSLEFVDQNKNRNKVHSRWTKEWHQVFDLFKFCPWESQIPRP